ncbi:MAG: hypothetical protein LKF96_00765 [Treponema sp.]|jgi:hypothetical protein|nr:hypothetical protein [Treponema sp.]
MKIEKEFTADKHFLYTSEGEKVPTDDMSVFEISDQNAADVASVVAGITEGKMYTVSDRPVVLEISGKTVEPEEGMYNEAFLAYLREILKSFDEYGLHAIISPVAGADLANPAAAELFTAAAKHIARRIKDCRSVIGFTIPDTAAENEDFVSAYIQELQKKHSQYVFFAREKTDGFYNDVVLY